MSTGRNLTDLLDRADELVHADPAAALALATTCATAAEATPEETARARYLSARVRADRGEFDDALLLIDEARSVYWSAGAHLQALRTDLGRMQVLDDVGRHREAAELGERLIAGLDDLESGGDEEFRTWLRAAAAENTGIAFGYVGEQERALAAYRRAEADYEALELRADVGRARANQGIELLELGRARQALDALTAAAAIFAEQDDRLWSAKCDGYRARAHRLLGELVPALRLLEAARAVLDGLEASAEAIRLELLTAETYLDLALYSEARTAAAQAADDAARLGMPHDEAAARYAVALAALGTGDDEGAAESLRAVAVLLDEVGDPRLRAQVWMAEADAAAAHRPEDARRLAGAAATELQEGGWLVPLVSATLRQADLADDDTEVAALLDRAAGLLDETGARQLRYPYQLRQARRYRGLGHDTAAEGLLRTAIDSSERLGNTLLDHTMRTAFRSERTAAADELVDLLVERGGPDAVAEAFRLSGAAKSQTLTDICAGAVPASTMPADDTELHSATADLKAAYTKLFEITDPVRRAELQRTATMLENRISLLRLRASTSLADPRPVAAPVRSSAAPVLMYHSVGNDLVGFVAHGNDIRVRRLPGAVCRVRAELDQLTAQWSRFRIGTGLAGRHLGTLRRTTDAVLGGLYAVLLAPLTDLLESVDTELTIVPDRRLSRVPFHALYDGSAYLMERFTTTISPMPGGPGGHEPANDSALVLAVPDEGAPWIGAEADMLSALLPGATVLRGDAASGAALREALPGPGLLHVACHGLYRRDNPLFSSLRLGDGSLTSADVLRLDLGGALVTLSACESGRHGDSQVEPVGLAWAFLAAGAAGAVVSRWLVDDRATVDLMSGFYHRLRAGQPPAHALRGAQLTVAEEYPHPYYWAPFSYVAPEPSRRPR